MYNKLVKLGDLFEITSGGTPSRSNNAYYKDGMIHWAKTGDLKNMYLTNTSEFITDSGLRESSAKLFPKGTVLIAMYGATIGNCSVLSIEAASNQACAAFTPIEEILPEFLYYYLVSIKQKLVSLGVGGAQPNISISILKNIQIPFISLQDQGRIVSVLNRSQDLINKRKGQIDALDQLTQSVFQKLFSTHKGERVPLSELCEINPPKSEVSKLDGDSVISFIPMANVSENGEVDLNETRKIKDVYKGFTYFKENDVLFAKITPCMENGKGAIVRNLENGVGFGSTEFHVLRPKENIKSEWLYYLTTMPKFRMLAEKNMTGSAGQKRVPKQFFDKYKIEKPSVEAQERFKEIVTKIENQKGFFKKSLSILETNYQSIMQRAFKGELFTEEKVSNL